MKKWIIKLGPVEYVSGYTGKVENPEQAKQFQTLQDAEDFAAEHWNHRWWRAITIEAQREFPPADRLAYACQHFNKSKLVRIEPNGFDIDTGKPSIPGAYVNASTWREAIDIISAYTEHNIGRENILLDEEIDRALELSPAEAETH